jgi:hypothetical protein
MNAATGVETPIPTVNTSGSQSFTPPSAGDWVLVLEKTVQLQTWYRDFDEDGFGDPDNSTISGSQPSGYVADNTDCDDADANNYPGNTEACDGQDNDCDAGTLDGANDPFFGMSCDGSDADLCAEGTYDGCVDGTRTCSDNTGDNLDICDGLDNDCRPATADGSGESWLGDACDGTDADLCTEGTYACVSGSQFCGDITGDTLDICDGLDNDCNPSTADGFDESWLGDACDGPDSDQCDEGTFSCESGTQTCSDITGDTLDICDGQDNDCNPATADGTGETWLGDACDGADADLCTEGTYSCQSGAQTCSDQTGNTLEICDDTLDNDCDGMVDGDDPDCMPDNTDMGTDVLVAPVDSNSGGTPVSITFGEVTQSGLTSLTTGATGPASPTGMQLGNPPVYFDITTTASYAGTIVVCIDYSGITYAEEANLKLYHYESSTWMDITSSLDPANNIICGKTISLSTFAAFEPSSSAIVRDDGGGGGGCFIATAAYGSYEAPYVKILRDFRDEILFTSSAGKWFVATYYRYSPPAARWLGQNSWAKPVVRVLLLPLVGLTWFILHLALWVQVVTLLTLLLLFMQIWIINRRQHSARYQTDQ